MTTKTIHVLYTMYKMFCKNLKTPKKEELEQSSVQNN